MSDAEKLKNYLAEFTGKSSTSVNIGDAGDEESETANLLGWAKTGFGNLVSKASKIQENIPLPNPLRSSDGGSSWLSEAESDPFCPKLSKKQRILGFMGCIGMGILCFMMAAMYLPVLIISARKFALLYTLGSIFFISSFSLLYGPKKHFKHLISNERLPFTAGYTLSMSFTLYAAMGAKSYILTVIAAAIQIVALSYFTLSYIPGGQTALKFFAKMFYALFSRCFKSAINV
ncbi:unnamed protein product [Oikopleura dioica]|uniref:Vesicle transport protein n=1 Tax=Oikopleura dioica TaxID=34765 RepID=E4YHL6_OIKDI|nr:unnamed protein product [Oikopleura dioica]